MGCIHALVQGTKKASRLLLDATLVIRFWQARYTNSKCSKCREGLWERSRRKKNLFYRVRWEEDAVATHAKSQLKKRQNCFWHRCIGGKDQVEELFGLTNKVGTSTNWCGLALHVEVAKNGFLIMKGVSVSIAVRKAIGLKANVSYLYQSCLRKKTTGFDNWKSHPILFSCSSMVM